MFGSVDRRRFVRSIVAGLLPAVTAGCGARRDDDSASTTPTTTTYPHLRREPVYLDRSFDPELPSFVEVVDDPTAATLAVLGPESAVTGSQVVDWLRAGVAVSVTGRPAAERLADLVRAGRDGPSSFDEFVGVSGTVEMAAFDPGPDGHVRGTIYVGDAGTKTEVLDALERVLDAVRRADSEDDHLGRRPSRVDGS